MPAGLTAALKAATEHDLRNWVRAGARNPRLLGELLIRIPAPIAELYYALRDSRRILKAASPDRKILFVDGGAHTGGGFRFFSAYFPPGRVDYDVFEPNPHCRDPLRRTVAAFDPATVRIHAAALSTRNGTARLFGLADHEGGPLCDGASLNPYQHSVFLDFDPAGAIDVPTIDFCDFIEAESRDYDTIVVKLDVEGAENDLLEALIDRDLLRFIDTLYVEFHAFFLKNPSRRAERRREARLVRQLKQSSTHFRVWH